MTAIRSTQPDLLFYLRVSKDELGDRLAVTRQRAKGKDVQREIGARRVTEFEDNDTSASGKVERPGFDALLDAIASGAHDGAVLYAYAWDRLTRNGMDGARLIAACTLHDVRIICPADGLDRRPATEGAFMENVRTAVAEEELRKLRKRVNDKLAQKRDAGQRCGKVPFGWNPDGSAHPVQARLITEGVERHLAGHSLASLAAEWDGAAPRPDGKRWTGQAVRRMLVRETNAAIYMHKGERLDVTAQWDALISEDQHLAIKARVNTRRRDDLRRSLLGGIPVCGRCNTGHRLYASTQKQRGVRYFYYACHSNLGGCWNQLSEAKLDEYVERAAVERLTKRAPADLITKDKAIRLRALTTAIEADEARQIEGAALFAARTITAAQLTVINRDLAAKLGPAWAERDALLSEDGDVAVLAQLVGPGAAQAWQQASDDIKRAAIRALMRVTLNGGNAWHTPLHERITVEFLR